MRVAFITAGNNYDEFQKFVVEEYGKRLSLSKRNATRWGSLLKAIIRYKRLRIAIDRFVDKKLESMKRQMRELKNKTTIKYAALSALWERMDESAISDREFESLCYLQQFLLPFVQVSRSFEKKLYAFFSFSSSLTLVRYPIVTHTIPLMMLLIKELEKFERVIPAGREYASENTPTAFLRFMKGPAGAAKAKLEKYFCKDNFTDNMLMCLVIDPAVKTTWFFKNGYSPLEVDGIKERYSSLSPYKTYID
jgi:hypothetical protein